MDKSQKNAIKLFEQGFNLFITGGAGTGKSYLVQKIIENFKKKNYDIVMFENKIAVTSTTGISSLNINGRTLHSWSGLGIYTPDKPNKHYLKKIKGNRVVIDKWLKVKLLIIDEVSMLQPEMLDTLDFIAREIRGVNLPFGGIQVILTGDFFQLPPVYSDSVQKKFCFESQCWSELIDHCIELKTSHRQNEKELIKFLNHVRKAKINDFVKKQLEKFKNNPNYNKNYTHIYPKKYKVLSHNLAMLKSLPGETFEFQAKLKSNILGDFNLKFPKDTIVEENLVLKPGAFIIINKNIDFEKGLVNGRQAIFKSLSSTGNLIVQLDNGMIETISRQTWEYELYDIEQFPVLLAWAITIHKAQGMGIEKLSVDIGHNVFEDGQSYVALSRAVSSKYLHIQNYNVNSIKINNKVLKFYRKISKIPTKWYEFKDDNGKLFYQNVLTDETVWKLPKNGTVEKYNESNNEETKDEHKNSNDIFQMMINSANNLCQFCGDSQIDLDYKLCFDELICKKCILQNNDFELINKKDVKNHFRISEDKLKKLQFKKIPNPINPRYRGSRMYLTKHLKKASFVLDKNIENKKINKKLFDELKIWRKNLALLQNQPSYFIVKDKTIDEISRLVPSNVDELLSIKGLGKKKCSLYSDSILHICKKYN